MKREDVGLSSREIIDEIRSHVGDGSSVRSLSGPDYMRCHVAFENASNQQSQILHWLVDTLTNHAAPTLSIASVGAGSGILDIPLLRALCVEKTVEYTVVEPVAEQASEFARRATDAFSGTNPSLRFLGLKLEELDTSAHHDFVLAIHSIYYMEDVGTALDRLLRMRKPDGRLIVALAPREDMNELARVFWAPQLDQRVWWDRDAEQHLRSRDKHYHPFRINAELKIPRPGESAASDILSFLVQTRFDRLSETVQDLVTAYLRLVGNDDGQQLAVPHPVTILTVDG
jgi:SAM-dependent methyltransferase